MKIIIHGLGRMGMQIAHKLADNSHQVIAFNRSQEKVQEASLFGALPADSQEKCLSYFKDEPVVVWLMLPADIVDSQVEQWLNVLPQESIIIDGGNSNYKNTQKLNDKIIATNQRFIDIGVSGGVWGYDNGFSMMVGSDSEEAFRLIEPALKDLAQPEGGYGYFGKSGSGHFVKMVHNAIEYGMMESLAEGYHILKAGPYQIDLGLAGDVWQKRSVITSWLNSLCRDGLIENPNLEGNSGYVAENGEARWTLETAQEYNIPMTAIQAALDVRLASQAGNVNFATKLLAEMRNRFGGHAYNKND